MIIETELRSTVKAEAAGERTKTCSHGAAEGRTPSDPEGEQEQAATTERMDEDTEKSPSPSSSSSGSAGTGVGDGNRKAGAGLVAEGTTRKAEYDEEEEEARRRKTATPFQKLEWDGKRNTASEMAEVEVYAQEQENDEVDHRNDDKEQLDPRQRKEEWGSGLPGSRLQASARGPSRCATIHPPERQRSHLSARCSEHGEGRAELPEEFIRPRSKIRQIERGSNMASRCSTVAVSQLAARLDAQQHATVQRQRLARNQCTHLLW